ncbi:MAG TPA: RecX family transcriptional regulator [Actinomycetota bacterium]|nr:RecX family transcriptional regulator [Actinomycetota bacterium]
MRPRTRRELGGRLRRAGFDPTEVEEELDRLATVGLLDDGRFAAGFAEAVAARRLASSRSVRRELVARGVDPKTAARAAAPYEGWDEERALALARARAARLGGLEPEAAFRRLVSLLSRRGYEPGTAVRAARVALGLDPEPEA